jgi:hypothetical protein
MSTASLEDNRDGLVIVCRYLGAMWSFVIRKKLKAKAYVIDH